MNPIITMPKVPSDSDMDNYGWIQYAKGCVVRNLSISYPSPVSINKKVTKTDNAGNSETVDEGGVGGGVIATVLGGENIIDGASVTGTCFTAKNQKVMIGGYVGVVNAGGVLLRNVSIDSLEQFSVSDMETAKEYPNVCGIVGKVLKLLIVPNVDYNRKNLVNYLRSKLEPHKVPVLYDEIAEVRRTFNGKIDRKSYR